MKKLLVAIFAFCALPADAGLVCASAPELKVLQSTALQQQLMVASLTCHMREDYGRFIAAYRDGLAQSDQALKAFFAARPRGEDYNAYKMRIANAASLRSVHDPQFCDSARKVFDMALGRRLERRGLAAEPPQLVDTGYEGCRAVDDRRLIEAKAQPAAKLAQAPKPMPRPADVPAKIAVAVNLKMVKPIPAPKPVVSAEAARALSLRPQIVAQQAVMKPLPAAVLKPVPAVPNRIAANPSPMPKPLAPLPAVALPVTKVVSALPQTVDKKLSPVVTADQPGWSAETPSANEDPSRLDGTAEPPRVAAVEPQRNAGRQGWRQPRTVDEDDPYTNNSVPYAYRPGTEWVGDAALPSWRANYDRPPPRAHWVLDPYGRWVLVVPRAPHWVRD
jgi:hypothetical protein